MAVLAQEGQRADGEQAGLAVWRFLGRTPDGMKFEIRCTGPGLPSTVPGETISPADIPKDPQWRGSYRLVVEPPLIALDLCWRAGEPLRIMTFSRGDWEALLRDLAARSTLAGRE